ncbi:hypothetical protein ACFL4W_01570 [Planctomycetota bacterium]
MSKLIIIVLLPGIVVPLYADFDGTFGIEKDFLEQENFLDWKAYQDGIPWRYGWYEARNGLKVNVGSLSQERFYWHQEMRFQIDFSESIAFLYEYQQDEFWATMTPYQEAEFRFGKDLAFSLLGFTMHEKRYHNFGFALAYGRRASLKYIRLSHLRFDAGFNDIIKKDEKVSGDEKYRSEPGMSRAEIKCLFDSGILIELDLKKEQHIELRVPGENADKNYEGFNYFARMDWRIDERWLAGISGHLFQEERWLQSMVSTDFTDQIIDHDGLDIYAAVQLDENNYLTTGFMHGGFANAIDSNDILNQYDTSLVSSQIYGIWLNTRSEKVQMFYSLQIGSFDLFKEDQGILEEEDDGLDMKAGIGVIVAEKDNYRFMALSTWDLDLFVERQWDGGSIRLQVYF